MNCSPRSSVVAIFLLLFLALACKNQSDSVESSKVESSQKAPTQAPLLVADPVSEDQLRQASYEGNGAKVKEYLEQGVNVNAEDPEGRTALIFAAFNGHSEILLDLFTAGAKVDSRDMLGRTALMYASTGPFPEAVKILLDKGAEPNVVDSDEHFTALMHAAAEGQLEVVKVLMSHGADHTLKDIDGDDAASFAQQAGHTAVVNYLQGVH
ncbi:MAG: ankyrin repeat domain-containing protein [Bacteroidia bacterium]|nr:MAG: ankyrin repeat domain-containing protein [Bacteroidia bacterium]